MLGGTKQQSGEGHEAVTGTFKGDRVKFAIDGCPSTPGGCREPSIRERFPERFNPLEARLAEMENPAADEEEEDIGWFFVDDDGEIHEL